MFEILGITFYAYGFLIGLGAWLAMEISLTRRQEVGSGVLEKSFLWTILGGVVGARLYHVLDYWNEYYSTNTVKIIYLWEGGLGIWGAIVGGMLGLAIYCYFNKVKYLKVLDSIVVGVPLAQAIGRVGNYINGELYGKNGQPLFAYEGIFNLVLFGILWFFSKRKRNNGFLSGMYILGYGIIRVFLENIRQEGDMWKIAGFPIAIIIGSVAVLVGGYLIFRRKQS